MKTKLTSLLIMSIISMISMISMSTYAAGGSLWVEVDVPLKDPKDAVREQIKKEDEAAKAIAESQKTICDVLIAQPSLNIDDLNNTATITKLRNEIQLMPDEYKALLSTNDAMKNLYKEYRAKYIKVYCAKN